MSGSYAMQTETVIAREALRIGDTVTLIVGQQSSLSFFEAKVLSMLNGGVVISEPVCVEGDNHLQAGLPLTVQVCRGGSVFQFESAIKSIRGDEINQAILNPPQSVRSVQRRDFVRLGFRRDVSFAPVPGDICWRDWEDQIVWHEATTCDLSGSGLLLENTIGISENDLLLLRLPFFDDINIGHPILSVCRRAGNAKEGSPVGVEFIFGRSLGAYIAKDDLSMLPRAAVRFDILEQVKLSHFVLGRQIRRRREEQ